MRGDLIPTSLSRTSEVSRDNGAEFRTPDSDPEIRNVRTVRGWDPKSFAREQIRGLVRQVFFSNAVRPVRQVVLSPVNAETEVRKLCRSVGEALARETSSSVAVVGEFPRVISAGEQQRDESGVMKKEIMPLHRIATRLQDNLWLIPNGARDEAGDSSRSLHSYLGEVRREFEYSVVQGPPASESDTATIMAQFADGIILVLSARHTRRATALQVKKALEQAQVRMIGTVLTERTFPVPEALYRRL
ncbi:MAG TPA: hypothetical protein VMG31_02985 [Verrucomicrobiae bacterium]|nr:hypothetical protein [Verrucomicrobiae bacterium]